MGDYNDITVGERLELDTSTIQLPYRVELIFSGAGLDSSIRTHDILLGPKGN